MTEHDELVQAKERLKIVYESVSRMYGSTLGDEFGEGYHNATGQIKDMMDPWFN